MDEVDLKSIRIDPKWAFKIPPAIALRRMALALGVIDGSLAVAMADPADARAAEAIAAACGMPVRPLAADRQRLREELLRVYGDARGSQAGADSRSDPVAAVDRILRAAALRQASDIHFCPVRDGLEVRMRIDGVIEPFCKLPAEMAPAATSRIKVLAGLDIAEKRAPQDGGFAWDAAKLGAGNSAID
ncbi:MAG: Flp pilus assembly complex ATPase component TadA, partial [Kiritimatiellae bacterium]|nr:Flp pilus assembly complex ATPase component TadA [Kiritimatiellia bacterium]